MREQLIRYVDLLFAGAPGAYDIKQEILQNTLDRYDDLVAQGKAPEAAYSLAISGIGDINEILGSGTTQAAAPSAARTEVKAAGNEAESKNGRLMRAVAIAFYILCPVPLFILSEFGGDSIGVSLMFIMIAAATALIIMAGKRKSVPQDGTYPSSQPAYSPRQELRKSIKSVLWAVGLVIYFALSLSLQAWYITWVIFPLTAAVQGLVMACMDLKEANQNER